MKAVDEVDIYSDRWPPPAPLPPVTVSLASGVFEVRASSTTTGDHIDDVVEADQ